ncbi:MAG: NusG domain II-containing protein [Magnetococcales bacterium]|nr:NusG domain II-containing protein [Magnetococcales bacterium]
MNWLAGWRQCTNATDRWMAFVTALGILVPCLWTLRGQSDGMVVIRDALSHEIVWPLRRDTVMEVAGRLGPVRVEVRDHRVRLLEYQSPRLVGTMIGWIARPGQLTACIPCGVVIQIKGQGKDDPSSTPDHYDGIIR